MPDPAEVLAQRLFTAVPGLRAEQDDYQRRYVGDWAGPPSDAAQLPGFLVKLALDCRRRGAERRELPRQLFEFFESELGRDDEIDGLIEACFVAYLPEPGDRSAAVLELIGPKLWEARADRLLDDQAAVLESVAEFVYRLGDDVPELRDRLDRHLEHGRYSRLADAVLTGIVADAVALVAAGQALIVLPLLEFLESEYGANPGIDNVIDVAFLELLPDPGESGRDIVDLLGPELRASRLRMDPPAGQRDGNR